ncbi:MAG: hypothetical protein OHK0023_00160 [Anaerolineae bacterium]
MRGAWIQRTYQREMHRFYREFIRDGDLVFDIGAHKGSRTEVYLRLGARVVAVEPQADCIAHLRQKYGDNPRFACFHGGVADAVGEMPFYHSPSYPRVSSFLPEWRQVQREIWKDHAWDAPQTVAVTTLDVLIAEYGLPAFIKIDVEGFELQVLRGLSHPVPTLAFEATPTSEQIGRARAAMDHLQQIGRYTFNATPMYKTFRWLQPQWTDADTIEAMLHDRTEQCDIYARLGR